MKTSVPFPLGDDRVFVALAVQKQCASPRQRRNWPLHSRRGWIIVIFCLLAHRSEAQVCSANCNYDAQVSLAELLFMVGTAVADSAPPLHCPPRCLESYESTQIQEIVAAVQDALHPPFAEDSGSCWIPGARRGDPLRRCQGGIPIRVYADSCDSSNRGSLLATTTTDREGLFEVQYPTCGGTRCFEAEVANGVVYRDIVPGPANTVPTCHRRRDARAADREVRLDPLSEATVRLVVARDVANFAADTFSQVEESVRRAVPAEDLGGIALDVSAQAAVAAAEGDRDVITALNAVLRHDETVAACINPGSTTSHSLSLLRPTSVFLQIRSVNGDFDPCMRLAGQEVCAEAGLRLVPFFATLPGGTHPLELYASNSSHSGCYHLTYVRLGEEDATPLRIGASVGGAIEPVGDLDVFGFQLAQAATVHIALSPAQSPIQPCAILWKLDANGALPVFDACTNIETSLAAGAYLVLVSDRDSDQTGDYSVMLETSASRPLLSSHGARERPCFGQMFGGLGSRRLYLDHPRRATRTT